MDSGVTISVQGRSVEEVGSWLQKLRALGLVPMAGGRVVEQPGRPGHFMARLAPTSSKP